MAKSFSPNAVATRCCRAFPSRSCPHGHGSGAAKRLVRITSWLNPSGRSSSWYLSSATVTVSARVILSGASAGGASRELHPKNGSLAQTAFDGDRSSVGFHNLPGDVQSQSQSPVVARGDSPLESFEDERQALLGDSGAGIPHGQRDGAVRTTQGNVDRLALAEFDCVRQQIGNDLFQPHLIPQANDRRRGFHAQVAADARRRL